MTQKRRPGRKFIDSHLLAKAAKIVSEEAEKEGVEIALLGGAAMQFYGSPRLTGDVDFVADKTIESSDKIRQKGVLSIGGKKYVVIDQVPADVIVREDEYTSLYQEALELSKETDEGFYVVTAEHLAAIKFATQRSKDDVDLMWLIAQKNLVDIKETEGIVRRHLGSHALKDFKQVYHTVQWRSREGEFDDKFPDDGSEE